MSSVTSDTSTDQEQIVKLHNSIDELTTELTDYIAAVDAKIGELNESIRIMNAKVQSHIQVSEQLREEKVQIDDKLGKLIAASADSDTEMKSTLEALNELQQKLEETTLQNTALNEEKNNALEQLEAVKETADEVTRLTEENNRMKEEIVVFETKIANLNSKMENERIANKKLNEGAFLELNATIATIESQREAIKTELDEKIRELTDKTESARATIEQLENDVKSSKNETLAAKKAFETAAKSANAALGHLESISKQKEEVDKQISGLEKEKNTLNAANAACKAKIVALNKQIEDANNKIVILQDMLSSATRKLNTEQQSNVDVIIDNANHEQQTSVNGNNANPEQQTNVDVNGNDAGKPLKPNNNIDPFVNGSIRTGNMSSVGRSNNGNIQKLNPKYTLPGIKTNTGPPLSRSNSNNLDTISGLNDEISKQSVLLADARAKYNNARLIGTTIEQDTAARKMKDISDTITNLRQDIVSIEAEHAIKKRPGGKKYTKKRNSVTKRHQSNAKKTHKAQNKIANKKTRKVYKSKVLKTKSHKGKRPHKRTMRR